MESTIAKYSIHASRINDLTATVDKISKRAAKLGLPPVYLTVGPARDVAYVTQPGGGMRRWAPQDGADPTATAAAFKLLQEMGRVVYHRFHEVTVEGDAPTVGGWQFCATLVHVSGDDGRPLAILNVVPGLDAQLPAKFRTATPEHCDHCLTKRRRNETFVVRKTAEVHTGGSLAHRMHLLPVGTWLQVGRNCLADFFPGADPHALAARLESLLAACGAASAASGDGWLGEGGYGGGRARWSLRHVLATAAALIRADGWMSRGRAREARESGMGGVSATADDVMYYLNPPRGGEALAEWRRWVEKRPVTDADRAAAETAVDYARAELDAKGDARDDYEHNLHVACQQESVDDRLVGIVCSLLPYHARQVERQVAARRAGASQHVGAVGDKLALRQLTLVKVTTCDGSYGTSWLHAFVDTDGNNFKWFSSKRAVRPVVTESAAGPVHGMDALVEGQTYAVWGTVKDHGEFRGVKETVLTRCVVAASVEAFDAHEAEEAAKAAKKAARAAKAAAKLAASSSASPVAQ